MFGTLWTTDVGALRYTRADEHWLVTRGGGDIVGTIRVRELAPSPALFHQYVTRWRGRPPEEWWGRYEGAFKAEMKNPVVMEALRRLYRRLQDGTNVALVCYCRDPEHCHRRLLGDFLSNHGVTVLEACRQRSLRLL